MEPPQDTTQDVFSGFTDFMPADSHEESAQGAQPAEVEAAAEKEDTEQQKSDAPTRIFDEVQGGAEMSIAEQVANDLNNGKLNSLRHLFF